MKITFNLNSDHAQAYNNFLTNVKPEELSEADFARTAFLIGLRTMEQAVIQQLAQEASNQQEQSEQEKMTDDSEATSNPEAIDGVDIIN